MQVNEIDPNFRIILITPPQFVDGEEYNKLRGTFREDIIYISKMWGFLSLIVLVICK